MSGFCFSVNVVMKGSHGYISVTEWPLMIVSRWFKESVFVLYVRSINYPFVKYMYVVAGFVCKWQYRFKRFVHCFKGTVPLKNNKTFSCSSGQYNSISETQQQHLTIYIKMWFLMEKTQTPLWISELLCTKFALQLSWDKRLLDYHVSCIIWEQKLLLMFYMQLKSHIWKPNAIELHCIEVTYSRHIQSLANHTEAEWVARRGKTRSFWMYHPFFVFKCGLQIMKNNCTHMCL